jgi:hypothetical protein
MHSTQRGLYQMPPAEGGRGNNSTTVHQVFSSVGMGQSGLNVVAGHSKLVSSPPARGAESPRQNPDRLIS